MKVRCPHCGGPTVSGRLSINTLARYYKCTTTGCRCSISRLEGIVRVEGECLTMYRTGREVHIVPVANK